jgi:hypothetical protein
MPPNLSIFIASCDAYTDAWPAFFHFFFKYWPDCPYPIYLATQTKVFSDARVTTLTTNEIDWAVNVRRALEQINTEYILYLQEDYFLRGPISNEVIERLKNTLISNQAACLRLYPAPGPNQKFKNETEIGAIKPNTSYRLSLQAALWHKQTFYDLIRENESPWQLEDLGSKRTNSLTTPFLSVYSKKLFPYVCTAIVKGKWTYDALFFCQAENFPLAVEPRGLEKYSTYRRRQHRSWPVVGKLFAIFHRLNKKFRPLLIKTQ